MTSSLKNRTSMSEVFELRRLMTKTRNLVVTKTRLLVVTKVSLRKLIKQTCDLQVLVQGELSCRG